MTVVLLPDIEQLLSQFLRDQDEVADLVDDRIYTVLPKDKTFPLIRIHRYSGAPAFSRPLHLDQALVQVDCWGGNKKLAWEIAETCRAVCAERLVGSHDEGCVTSVTFGELSDQPDGTFDPPRPRFLFSMTVTAHPSRLVGS